jgi:hypothetical protein
VRQVLELPLPDGALRARCLLAAGRLEPTAAFAARRGWAEAALAAADRAGDDALAATALATLGHLAFDAGEVGDAVRRPLDTALVRAEASGDETVIALALLRLTLCDQGTTGSGARRDRIQRGYELYRRLGNRRGQLWCLAELGFDHLVAGRAGDAAREFDRGLALARELGYPHGEGWMLDALGEAAGAAGDFERSRQHFLAAHDIQRRIEDDVDRGWTLGGLVRACGRLGDLPGALRWLDEYTHWTVALATLPAYAFLLRVGTVAVLAGESTHAARVLGALDGLAPPESLSPTDHADHASLEAAVTTALAPAAATAARQEGRGCAPVDLANDLLAACTDHQPPV